MEKDVFIIMPHEYFLHRVKLQVFETFDAFKFHNQVIISSTVIDFANDMFYIIFLLSIVRLLLTYFHIFKDTGFLECNVNYN